ncbi:hypothetical protein AAZX31_17G193800 [Glycine max]
MNYEKLKKKRKVEKLIESQHGALYKFKNVIEQPPIDNTNNGVEQPPRNDTDNGENVIEQPPINNIENTNRLWKNIDGKFRNLMIEKGPIRHDNFQYPKDENNGYFYSSYLDKVYCFCCKLFGSTNVSQLANEGTKDWKNLGSKLKSHETNREHIINMTKWIELENRLTTKQTIDKHIQEQINKEKEHWEKVLLGIIAIAKYLSKNNLAFRGTNEKIYEKGNGNFLSLIEMLAEFDPIMQEHVRCIKSNETHNHFLSNTIQNELIKMIVFQFKKSIIDKVKDAKYFSVILDCTSDVSHQEQMTLILRCVDTSKYPIKIDEYFLEFLKLVNVLKKYGLNIDDIRGQGYDNGSNMKGKNQGVQRRLLDINPRAFYTSCGSSPRTISFFGVLQCIYSLFASYSKRRIESVKAIKFHAPKVRDALTELSKKCEDPKLKSETMSLATHELEDFEFLLGMNICKILQSKDMHIDVAIDYLKGLITYLKHYRENGFALALESTEKMVIEMDIEPKFCEKRKIHRKSHFDENISNEITHSPEESFRTEYFLYILDQSINSIETRFEQFLQYETIFELKVLREVLREEISTPIEVLISTAEKSFSKLKLLKSYLKSTMLQDRLNELTILSIESEVLELLDYKTLINDFATKKARRLL